jgi:flagellar biosynthesis/type III secretory pathway M-ring protein FliF/YscJ
MDVMRRMLGTIKEQLARLGPTERLFIASVVVILVMGLFLVSQFAARPSLVPLLPGVAVADQQRAQAFLSSSGFQCTMVNNQAMVPMDQKGNALALLTANKQMPSDTSGFFQSLIAAQSWSNSRQMNEAIYNAALKSELDKIISAMPGIKSASVLFEVPEASGLGASTRRPTASVGVFTESGAPLEQKTVDAIAYLVGGAKAGLSADRVRVIDGAHGQRKPTAENDIVPTTYLEHAAKVESDTQRKISDLLSYIPGVVVAVTAQVDVTRVTSREQRFLNVGEGSISANRKSTENTTRQVDAGKGAEPGVRSNQPADINRGGKSGSSHDSEESEKENEIHAGSRTAETVDPRGMPTLVAVSINVPRAFVAQMLKGADGKPSTDDKAITDAFEKTIRPEVKASILPHVKAMSSAAGAAADSQVVVSLTPMDMALSPGAPANQAGLLGGFGGGGGVGGGGGGGGFMGLTLAQIIDKAVLAVLGLGALGFMFMMVRKAGRKQDLPSAEELVGLPPALETKTDLIGEADESDTPLAGIELGEGEVRTQKLMEQVTDLVKTNPEGAAKLIRRWVSAEE